MSIQPIRQAKLPLAVEPNTRDKVANKDARLINGYLEKDVEDGVIVYKRPGFGAYASLPGVTTLPNGTARGVYYSTLLNAAFAIVGTNFYSATSAVSLGSGLSVSSYPYAFVEIPAATPVVFMNVAAGAVASGFTWNGTTFTSVGSPQRTVPGCAYLDSTIYVMTSSGAIRGSNINDPTTWPALNTIQASQAGDTPVFLARQKVYVIAMCARSTTVFFDNSNPTGSPLSLLPGGQSSVGCFDAGTVQTMGDEIMWVGQSDSAGIGVYLMRDLHITKVSIGSVDRMLTFSSGSGPWTSAWCGAPGHRFYIVNLIGQGFSLVYDLENNLWYEWSTFNGATLPFMASMMVPSLFGGSPITGGNAYIMQNSAGPLYYADAGLYTDYNGQFTLTLVTENWDGGSRFKKYLKQIDFITDQVASSSISVNYTEDDYQTFSNVRTVDLSVKRPNLTNCGTFRRRAYQITHALNTPLRLEEVIFSLQEGNL